MRNAEQWGKRITSLVLAASMMVSIASPVVVALEPTDDHYAELLAAAALLNEEDHDHQHDHNEEQTQTDANSDAGLSAVSADDVAAYAWPSHTHTYKWTQTSNATCTEPAIESYKCTGFMCGDVQETRYVEGSVALGHQMEWVVTQEPTCEQDGIAEYKCTRSTGAFSTCGYTEGETKVEKAPGHNYKGKVTTEPTCTEPGVMTYTCTNTTGGFLGIGATKCEASYTEEIRANGHQFGYVQTKDPTCTETGVETWMCTKAGCTETNDPNAEQTEGYEGATRTVPAKGHTEKTVTTAATCTENGKIELVCSVCGETTADTEVIEKLGHNYDSEISASYKGYTDVASTCTTPGKKYVICGRNNGLLDLLNTCTEVLEVEVPCDEHKWVLNEEESTAPTCTEDGENVYYCSYEDCSVKKKTVTAAEDESLKATGHKKPESNAVENKEMYVAAVCLTDGARYYECENFATCGGYVKEVEPAPGYHTGLEIYEKVEPTCYATGLTEGSYCHDCEKTIVPQTEIPKIAHTQSEDFHVFKEATCTDAGYEAKYCTECLAHGKGYVEVVIDEATDKNVLGATGEAHKLGDPVEVAPTCTEDGYSYQYCSICKQNIPVKNSTVTALGHEWDRETSGKKHDCQTVTFTQTCQREGCGFSQEVTDKATAEHDYTGEWKTEIEATCYANGKEFLYCKTCGDHIDTRDIASTTVEHTWKLDEAKSTAPTCENNGENVYYCTVCAEHGHTTTKTETVNSLGGHVFTNYVDDGNFACCEQTATAECDRDGCTATDTKVTGPATKSHKYTQYTETKVTVTVPLIGEQEVTRYVANCDYGCGATDTKNVVEYGEWTGKKAIADAAYNNVQTTITMLDELEKDPYSHEKEDIQKVLDQYDTTKKAVEDLDGMLNITDFYPDLPETFESLAPRIEKVEQQLEEYDDVYKAMAAISNAKAAYDKLDATTVTTSTLTKVNLANLIEIAKTAVAAVNDEAKKAEFEAQLKVLEDGYVALLSAAYVNEAATAIAAAENALAELDKDTVTSEQVTALNEKIAAAQTALAAVNDETKKAELSERLTTVSDGAKEMATAANTNALNQAKTAATTAVNAALAKYDELKDKENVTTAEVDELNKLIEEANKKLDALKDVGGEGAGTAWGELSNKLNPATTGKDALESKALYNDAVAALAAVQAEYDALLNTNIKYFEGFTSAFGTFDSLKSKAETAIGKVKDETKKQTLTDELNALQENRNELYNSTQAASVIEKVVAAEKDLKAQQDKLVKGTLTTSDLSNILNSFASVGNYADAWIAINVVKLANANNPYVADAESRLAAVEAGYNALSTALNQQTALKNAQKTVSDIEAAYNELLSQNITDENDERITEFGKKLEAAQETVNALADAETPDKLDGTMLPDGTTKKGLQKALADVAEKFNSIAGETLYNNAKAKVEAAVEAYNTLTGKELADVAKKDVVAAQDLVKEANAAIALVTNADRKAALENQMKVISTDTLTDLYNYTVAKEKIDAAEKEYNALKEKSIEDLAKTWKDSIGDALDAILGKGPFAAYENASKAAYEAIEAVSNGHDALQERMDAIEANVAALKEAVEDYQNQKDEADQAKKLAAATEAVEKVEADLAALQAKLVAGTLETSDLLESATIYVDILAAQTSIWSLDKSDAKTDLQDRLNAANNGATALSGALVNQGTITTADTAVKAAEDKYKEIYNDLENVEDISSFDTTVILGLITTAETAIALVPEPTGDTEADLLNGVILKKGDTYISKTTLEARLQTVKDGTSGLTDAYYVKIAEPLVKDAEKQLTNLQDKEDISSTELTAGLIKLKLDYSSAQTAVEKISETNETRIALQERLDAVAEGIEALEAKQEILQAKIAVDLAVEAYNAIDQENVSDTLLNTLVDLYDSAKEKVEALPDCKDKTELQNKLAEIEEGIEALREQLAIKKATELVEKAEKAVAAVDTTASTLTFVTEMNSAQEAYEAAQTAVEALKDSEAKTALEERLQALSKQIASKWGEFIKNQMADLWDQIKNGELDTSALETLKKTLEDLKDLSDLPIIGDIIDSTVDGETIDELIAMVDVALGSANLFNHAKKVINQLFAEIKAGNVTDETLADAKAVLNELTALVKDTWNNEVLQNMAKKLIDQITNAIEEAAAQAAIKVLQAIINDKTYDGFADAYHAVIDALNKLPDGSFKDSLIKELEDLKDQIKDVVTQQLNAILMDDTLSFEEKNARITQIEEEYDDFFQYIGLSGEFDKLIANIRTQLARLYINALKGVIANMATQQEIDAAYEAAVKAIETLGKYGFVDTEALLKELLEVLKEDIYDVLMEELNQILYDDVATYEEKIQQLKEYAKNHSDVLSKIGDLIDIDGWIQTILNEEMVKIIQNAINEIADIVGDDEMDTLEKIDALNALKNKIHDQIKGQVSEDVGAWLDKFDKAIQDAIDELAKTAGYVGDKILDAALTEVNKAIQEAESKEDLMAKLQKIYDDAYGLLIKLGQTDEQATKTLKELQDVIDGIEEALYYDKIDFVSWKTLQGALGTLLDSMVESDAPQDLIISVISDILTGNSGNLTKDGKIFALELVRDMMEDADWQAICHNLIDDAMNEVVGQIEDSKYGQYQIVQDLLDQMMDEMGDLAKEDLDEETIQKISQIFVDMLNNAIRNVENDEDYETIMRKARQDLSGLSNAVTGEVTRVGGDASKLLGGKLSDVINDRIPGGFLTNWIGNLAGGVAEWVANREISKYNKEIGNTITSYVKRYTCWKHNAVLTTVTEPTCESTGLQVYQCHNCDWIEEDMGEVVLDALGHIEVKDAAVEPTQTSYGHTEGSHCARCGKTLVAQQVISMLDPEIDNKFERAEISAKNLEAAGFASEAELMAAVNAALTKAGYTTANSECFQIRVNSSIGALPSNRFPENGVTGTLTLPSQTAGKMAQTYYAVQVFTADTLAHKAGDIVVTPIKLLNGGKNGMELTVYTEAIVVVAWKAAQ